MRQIVRGKTKDECEMNVDKMIGKGWKPVCEVKVNPGSYDLAEYVCVIRKDDYPAKGKVWGSKY